MSLRGLGRLRSRFYIRSMLFALVCVLFIASAGVTTASAYTDTTDTQTDKFEVEIIDAEYCDMDGDVIENDVHVLLRFDLGYALSYDFDYYITLTLPSGASYTYYVWIIAWAEEIYIHNVFYNYATESGDYTVDVDALMYRPALIWDYDYMIFDPPGGSAGSDPSFGVY